MNSLPPEINKEIKNTVHLINDDSFKQQIKAIQNSCKYETSLSEIASNLLNLQKIIQDNITIPTLEISKEIRESVQIPISEFQNVMSDMSKSFSELKWQSDIEFGQVVSNGNSEVPISNAKDVLILKSMFSNITFDECADFINYISKYPMLSYLSETGKKIYELVKKNNSNCCNDNIMYRVRIQEHNKKYPYTEDEMFEPPFKVTMQHRFSSNGQNYLYTSNDLDTAKLETGVEEKNLYTWMKMEVLEEFKMLNICNDSIPLFKYCHTKAENKKNQLNTAYLLPNYIADCAKKCGFNGIVYKSVIKPKTTNYVFFNVGKRDFKIIDIKSNATCV